MGGKGKGHLASAFNHDSDSDDSDNEEDVPLTGAELEQDGQGDEDDNMGDVLSPFGPETFSTVDECWDHAERLHSFSYRRLRASLGQAWDDLHRMRLVNKLRSLGPELAKQQASQISADSAIWKDDSLLQPAFEMDRLLFEGDDDFDADELAVPIGVTASSSEAVPTGQAGAMEAEILRLRAELDVARRLLTDVDDGGEVLSAAVASALPSSEAFGVSCQGRSFALGVADAIIQLARSNQALFQGKVVLDAGCHSGSLTCLAIQLGARAAVSLDVSAGALSVARGLVTSNGFRGAVTLARGRAEGDIPAPITGGGGDGLPDFDTLVSERLLCEPRFSPLMSSLLAARRRHLKPSGVVLPAMARLMICAVDLTGENAAAEAFNAWGDRRDPALLGGLPCLGSLAPPLVEILAVDANQVASSEAFPLLPQTLDLATAAPEDALPTGVTFRLQVLPDKCATALAIYWVMDLDRDHSSTVSGAPVSACASRPAGTLPPKQTVLHLQSENPTQVMRVNGAEFGILEGQITASMASSDASLQLRISLTAKRQDGSAGDLQISSSSYVVA